MTNNLTFRADKDLREKLRKLSEMTGFSITYIINEILRISFRNGTVRDLFWVYNKDHSDNFLNREITKGLDEALLLKEAFSVIQAVFSEQAIRVKDLEKSHNKIAKDDIANGKLRQLPLAKYLAEVDT